MSQLQSAEFFPVPSYCTNSLKLPLSCWHSRWSESRWWTDICSQNYFAWISCTFPKFDFYHSNVTPCSGSKSTFLLYSLSKSDDGSRTHARTVGKLCINYFRNNSSIWPLKINPHDLLDSIPVYKMLSLKY